MGMIQNFLISATLATALAACSPGALVGESRGIPTFSSPVLGGAEIPANHPATLSIVGVFDNASRAVCTGTLIAPNLVLTAAHCLNEDLSQNLVTLGNHIHQNVSFVKVIAAAATPHWEARQKNEKETGDMAILLLEKGLPAPYRPLSLLPEENARKIAQGNPVWLIGFGMNNGVAKSGAGLLRMGRTVIASPDFSDTEFSMDQNRDQGACHGDSGGPVLVFIGSQPYVLGVINRAVGDAKDECQVSSVATNVNLYRAWILETAEKLRRQSEDRNNPLREF